MSSESERERLAVLVHEVRSPTAALAAIAETVRGQTLEDSVRGDLARMAVAACRGIERIVMDATSTSIRTELVDLVGLVRDACAAAGLMGADVRSSTPSGAVVVEGDPLRLRQALDNLISNAVTHGSREVVVTLLADGDPRIEVSDDGVGIPARDQERIFESGVRLDDGRPGSGLGLAVARAIAEAHEGTLSVESRRGAGATFALVLPRSSSSSKRAEASGR